MRARREPADPTGEEMPGGKRARTTLRLLSSPHLKSQCPHCPEGQAHQNRTTRVPGIPKRKPRTDGNRETAKQPVLNRHMCSWEQKRWYRQASWISEAQTDVAGAKEITKPKCQGLFCDTVPLSNRLPSDVINSWKQVFRTWGGAQEDAGFLEA